MLSTRWSVHLLVTLGVWALATALWVGVTIAQSAGADVDVLRFGQAGWWVGLATLAVQALALDRRDRLPRGALVAVAAAAPVVAALGAGDATGTASLAVLVAVYAGGIRWRAARPVVALIVAGALVALGEYVTRVRLDSTPAQALGSALIQAVGTLGLPLVVAAVVLSRRETRVARAERTVAIGREHDALLQVAVSRERTAMARELHDIAAHHLTGIAVMTGAIERQIDADPRGAKVAVRQVRDQSTAMLRELRSLVGLLRDPTGEPGTTIEAGVETLAGLPVLVDTARRSGSDVDLTVLGELDQRRTDGEIGPLAQLSAYRTVQECLANAARHAPGARCEVVVDARDGAELTVSVRNDAPPVPTAATEGSGFGLVGMRERAELTDARLRYGPTPDGGWLVSLSIPTHHDPALDGDARRADT